MGGKARRDRILQPIDRRPFANPGLRHRDCARGGGGEFRAQGFHALGGGGHQAGARAGNEGRGKGPPTPDLNADRFFGRWVSPPWKVFSLKILREWNRKAFGHTDK